MSNPRSLSYDMLSNDNYLPQRSEAKEEGKKKKKKYKARMTEISHNLGAQVRSFLTVPTCRKQRCRKRQPQLR